MKRFLLLGAISLLTACHSYETVNTSVYMDSSRPTKERVEALLRQMTLDEKIGQMDMVSEWDEQAIFDKGYYNFGAWICGQSLEQLNKMQTLSEKTRLKIPYLIGADAAHGNGLISGRTIFPTSISMAATFNRDLVKQTTTAASREIRTGGLSWIFAPSVDVVLDARWGRTGETYGEDPYLASELVRQAVSGYQDHENPQDRVATSVKHLCGGGASVGGINHASADISERSVRNYILPPFKAAIEAGCMTIMPGHNDIGGIPAHASHWLLTDVVKNEFGFKGFYISDMKDMENLQDLHGTAKDLSDAMQQSVNAGLDMHMYSSDSTDFLVPVRQLVREGKISIDRIDDAVRRILTVKFDLGLFENRYADPMKEEYATPQARQLALEAARECIVLLKNEANLLPLQPGKYKRILVTGPNADNMSILGDWTMTQPDSNYVSILEGIQAEAGNSEIVYSYSGRIKGKAAKEGITNTTDPALQKKMLEEGGEISDYSISDAVSKARSCDLIVVAIGGYGIRSDWGLRTYGESADRPSIDFYGRQTELVKALYETGKPVVAVIVNGKPLNNEWVSQNIPAIVDVWEPGMYGGKALAEILFGKVCPSGKLPITVPKHAGQVPMYYYHAPSRYWTGYGLGSGRADDQPAYPFGHGLSYTQFEYSGLEIDTLHQDSQVELSFTVKNTGKMAGKEVPLLFVRDCVSSVVTPKAMLKEFSKIELQPGQEKKVHYVIPKDRLGLWNTEMKYVFEPGEFEFMVGRSHGDIRLRKKVNLQ